MAFPSLTPDTLARDLDSNPVTCQSSGCLSPAVYVLDTLAYHGDPNDPRDHQAWLICAYWECRDKVGYAADRLGFTEQQRYEATVRDLENLSGLAVIETIAGAA